MIVTVSDRCKDDRIDIDIDTNEKSAKPAMRRNIPKKRPSKHHSSTPSSLSPSHPPSQSSSNTSCSSAAPTFHIASSPYTSPSHPVTPSPNPRVLLRTSSRIRIPRSNDDIHLSV